MKFGASALLGFLLVASTSPGAAAFSVHPRTTTLVQQKLAQVQQPQQHASETGGWRSPLQMVAGGAEKAYGEDYYDGA